MSLKRSGEKNLDSEQFFSASFQYKDEILTEDKKLVSKQHVVWEKISNHLNKKYLPSSLHTKACRIKSEILLKFTGDKVLSNDDDTQCSGASADSSESSNIDQDLGPHSNNNELPDFFNFEFFITREEMDSIKELMLYNDNHRTGGKRSHLIFKQENYKNFFRTKVWSATYWTCGFHFEHAYISLNEKHGTLNGE